MNPRKTEPRTTYHVPRTADSRSNPPSFAGLVSNDWGITFDYGGLSLRSESALRK